MLRQQRNSPWWQQPCLHLRLHNPVRCLQRCLQLLSYIVLRQRLRAAGATPCCQLCTGTLQRVQPRCRCAASIPRLRWRNSTSQRELSEHTWWPRLASSSAISTRQLRLARSCIPHMPLSCMREARRGAHEGKAGLNFSWGQRVTPDLQPGGTSCILDSTHTSLVPLGVAHRPGS